MDKQSIQKNLIALLDSCVEGYSGEWDPDGEGKDGFIAMYDLLKSIAKDLNMDVSGAREIIEDPCQSCKKLGETICGNDTVNHTCFDQ